MDYTIDCRWAGTVAGMRASRVFALRVCIGSGQARGRAEISGDAT
jgi:hypothetical protein